MRDQQYQREYFEFCNNMERKHGVLPDWYKNEWNRRRVFEQQRIKPSTRKKSTQQRAKYQREYRKKRRRLPDDMMNTRRPQSDVDPQPPNKARKCMACRAEFMPRTNLLFRCDDCRRLHTANPPAHTEIIY